ncbi:MAG: HAD-IIIA family hydrolase [Candidatus Wolfebacteria bacterium]|nr:HAD-IIIA family hydrolase [Candidatus Wolfebacteria bacterium]
MINQVVFLKLLVNKTIKTEKNPAIFLDRDGTLTQRADLTWKKSQIKISPKITPFLRQFNKKNIPIIIITNQPVVARGWISEKGVEKLHQIIQKRIKKQKALINKFYFCPHHPEATIKKYRKNCDCRKPKIGLFKKAAKEFNINLSRSVTIGDMTQDILAGKKAGTKTILINSGHGGRDKKYNISPEYIAKTTADALKLAQKILK